MTRRSSLRRRRSSSFRFRRRRRRRRDASSPPAPPPSPLRDRGREAGELYGRQKGVHDAAAAPADAVHAASDGSRAARLGRHVADLRDLHRLRLSLLRGLRRRAAQGRVARDDRAAHRLELHDGHPAELFDGLHSARRRHHEPQPRRAELFSRLVLARLRELCSVGPLFRLVVRRFAGGQTPEGRPFTARPQDASHFQALQDLHFLRRRGVDRRVHGQHDGQGRHRKRPHPRQLPHPLSLPRVRHGSVRRRVPRRLPSRLRHAQGRVPSLPFLQHSVSRRQRPRARSLRRQNLSSLGSGLVHRPPVRRRPVLGHHHDDDSGVRRHHPEDGPRTRLHHGRHGHRLRLLLVRDWHRRRPRRGHRRQLPCLQREDRHRQRSNRQCPRCLNFFDNSLSSRRG
mmetsp:Transcript_17323/g.52716  ORF Transcript_17323/g.52716 Transcript_17323/m.52716 type:complete len:398 (+) Transcript_17323:291-1484(+)